MCRTSKKELIIKLQRMSDNKGMTEDPASLNSNYDLNDSCINEIDEKNSNYSDDDPYATDNTHSYCPDVSSESSDSEIYPIKTKKIKRRLFDPDKSSNDQTKCEQDQKRNKTSTIWPTSQNLLKEAMDLKRYKQKVEIAMASVSSFVPTDILCSEKRSTEKLVSLDCKHLSNDALTTLFYSHVDELKYNSANLNPLHPKGIHLNTFNAFSFDQISHLNSLLYTQFSKTIDFCKVFKVLLPQLCSKIFLHEHNMSENEARIHFNPQKSLEQKTENESTIYFDSQNSVEQKRPEETLLIKHTKEKPVVTSRKQKNAENSEQQSDSGATSMERKTVKSNKKHYCLYCHKFQSHLARHLNRNHILEKRVAEAFGYKKGSTERLAILDAIRKEGDMAFNLTVASPKVVVRNSSKPNLATYIPCSICKGYYSRKKLHDHIRLQHKQKENRSTEGPAIGQGMILGHSNIHHPDLCDELKNILLPTLQDKKVMKFALTDDTTVKYANLLVSTYYRTSTHNSKMIMTQIRQIARFFYTIQSLDTTIKTFADIFRPKYYDVVVKAIHNMAKLKNGYYESPNLASSTCTLLGKLCKLVKSEAIKAENHVSKTQCEDFEFLLRTHQNYAITKTVTETRTAIQRRKIEVLPTIDEIKSFLQSLEEEIDAHYQVLKGTYTFRVWKKLSELVLAFIMAFNRRRPGDVQRAKLVEYRTLSHATNDEKTRLNKTELYYANLFYRFATRFKLNHTGYILISTTIKDILDLLIQYRSEAGVPPTCPYLFANPKGKQLQYYDAAKALSDFARSKGFTVTKFTPTKLRKQLATCTQSLPSEVQQTISQFMDHSLDIHKNIYQQIAPQRFITIMGQLLTEANGKVSSAGLVNPTPSNTTVPTNVPWLHPEELEPNSLPQPETEPEPKALDEVLSRCLDQTPPKPNKSRTGHERYRTTKRTWMTPQRRTMRIHFSQFLAKQKEPTLTQVKDMLHESSDLQALGRTPQQIRLWVRCEILRNTNEAKKVSGWTTPQKQKIRNEFKDYYYDKADRTYPPINECNRVIDKFPILKNKSAAKIRSFVQHDFKLIREGKRSLPKYSK